MRLHRAAIVLEALGALRELLLPLAVVVLVGGGLDAGGLVMGVLGLGATAILGYVRWQATTYRVDGDGVRLRKGVLSPDEKVLPLARVAAVDVAQGPVQRLFGVLELHVQTPGGGSEPELVLAALAPREAARVRAALTGETGPLALDEPAFRLRAGRLLLAALTGPNLAVLAPVGALAGAVGDDLATSDRVERLLGTTEVTAGSVALVVLAAAALAYAVGVLATLLTLGGFRVLRDGDRLRIRRGVLSRRAASVPLGRVQAVRLVEGPLRQPLGLTAVRLETTGQRGEPLASRLLVPLASRAEARALVAELVPALGPGAQVAGRAALRRPPRRALRRYLLPPALVLAAVVAVAVLAAGLPWPLVAAAAIVGAGVGALRFADAGWQEAGATVLVRERRVARHLLVARSPRLQRVDAIRTPLQLRARLADLAVTVGSGFTARVRHLEALDAAAAFTRLRAAATGRGAA